jgi:hypothetical protein
VNEDRNRSYRLMALIALLAATFLVFSFAATRVLEPSLSSSNAENVRSVLANIAASFVFLLVLDIVYLLGRSRRKRRFKIFFGDLSESDKAIFVYPDFHFSAEAKTALEDLPEGTAIYQKHSTHFSGNRFIDVPETVASNDLLAIVLLTTRLGPLFGVRPRLSTDGEAISNSARSMISFGMTSNSVTDLYLSTDPTPMFDIEDAGGNPRIVLNKEDGSSASYGTEATHQHGLILRYRPYPKHEPQTCWFICAGLGAAGTPAAAWELAYNWKDYYKRFGNRDFAVVFRTSNAVESFYNCSEVDYFVRTA